MDKKILIGIGILLIGTLAYATQVFNDKVLIEYTDSQAFCVKEQFGPKVFFCINSTTPGSIMSTTIIPSGAPNESIGTANSPWPKMFSNQYSGQIVGMVAANGITCDQMCGSQNYACQSAIWADLTPSNCTDTGRLKNCICKT